MFFSFFLFSLFLRDRNRKSPRRRRRKRHRSRNNRLALLATLHPPEGENPEHSVGARHEQHGLRRRRRGFRVRVSDGDVDGAEVDGDAADEVVPVVRGRQRDAQGGPLVRDLLSDWDGAEVVDAFSAALSNSLSVLDQADVLVAGAGQGGDRGAPRRDRGRQQAGPEGARQRGMQGAVVGERRKRKRGREGRCAREDVRGEKLKCLHPRGRRRQSSCFVPSPPPAAPPQEQHGRDRRR